MAYGLKFVTKVSYSQQSLASKKEMLKDNYEWLQIQYKELAKKISKAIRLTIHKRTKTHNNRGGGMGLASAFENFTVTRRGTEFRIGIGQKGELNSLYPYWYALNYGRFYKSGKPFIPPPTIGYFGHKNGPIAGAGRTEIWHYNSTADYRHYMEPKRKVEAIKYIQVGQDVMRQGKQEILMKLKSRNARKK